jgi:IS5 family transposase
LGNVEKLETVTADTGYDWCLLRRRLRSEGVTPVIPHREHGWNGFAQNALIDDTTYHRRSLAETTFFAIRRKYGGTLRSRTWFGHHLQKYIDFLALKLNSPTDWFEKLLCYDLSR